MGAEETGMTSEVVTVQETTATVENSVAAENVPAVAEGKVNQSSEVSGTVATVQDPDMAEKTSAGKVPDDETDPKIQEMDAREKALIEKEVSLQKREIETEAREIMKERELPEAMLPYLIRGTRDETMDCIDKFEAAFAAALEEKYNASGIGNTPAGTSGNVTNGDKTIADIFAAALR